VLSFILLNTEFTCSSEKWCTFFSAFHLVECASKYLLFSSRAGHPVSLSDDCGGHSHSDAIRAICFSVSGALFASAGDDKLVKVWKTDSWRCIQTM
jgi:WD40 repeat protein